MKIRHAEASDVERLVVYCGTVPYHELQWQHVDFDENILANTIHHLIKTDGCVCLLLIDEEGEIRGFAFMFASTYFFSRDRYVSDLTFYVEPNSRKGFAGVRLIKEMIAFAKLQNVKELLLTVNSGVNVDRTVKLIERLGGRVLGKSMSVKLR